MIVLLDTSHDLAECGRELGCEVGQLLTPLTGFKNRGTIFGIDNGAFSGFSRNKFESRILREIPHKARCKFVAVPDVVGSADLTTDLFHVWKRRLCGWPLAYVLQDGLENVRIPWGEISAIFVGGSTKFKTSEIAFEAARQAKNNGGKWVHVGRVNSALRFDTWKDLADSCDGTGISKYSHMRESLARGILDFEGDE